MPEGSFEVFRKIKDESGREIVIPEGVKKKTTKGRTREVSETEKTSEIEGKRKESSATRQVGGTSIIKGSRKLRELLPEAEQRVMLSKRMIKRDRSWKGYRGERYR